MGVILSAAPLDLVDLLFDLEGLEVVEFGLVGLKLCVKFVLAGFLLWRVSLIRSGADVASPVKPRGATHGLVTLEQHDTSALVTCG